MRFEKDEVTARLGIKDGLCIHSSWDAEYHQNADWELHVILDGSCHIVVEEMDCLLSSGDAILIAPGKYHHPKRCSEQCSHFSISFSLTEGNLLTALKSKVKESIRFSSGKSLLRYINTLDEEHTASEPLKASTERALMTLLIVSMLRDLKLAYDLRTETAVKTPPEYTQLIDAFFQQYYAQGAGCTDLAAMLHMSTRQVGRIIKKHYGMTFREKLTQTRMNNAAFLLRTTDKRIQDIVEAVGYTSYDTFLKTFTAKFGTTPAKYRNLRVGWEGESEDEG